MGTREVFTNLGFIINDKKSVLDTHGLKHLGFVIDSVQMTVSLTEKKNNKLKNLCVNIVSESSGLLTIQNLSGLLDTSKLTQLQ